MLANSLLPFLLGEVGRIPFPLNISTPWSQGAQSDDARKWENIQRDESCQPVSVSRQQEPASVPPRLLSNCSRSHALPKLQEKEWLSFWGCEVWSGLFSGSRLAGTSHFVSFVGHVCPSERLFHCPPPSILQFLFSLFLYFSVSFVLSPLLVSG